VIEFLVDWAGVQAGELVEFLRSTYDPVWDTLDVAVVALAIYWLLLLIKGTRAVQILIGLMALVGIRLFAEFANLATLSWVFDNFLPFAPLMIVILFQADIRRALARVGRGFFPRLSERQETQILEEVVRAAGNLAASHTGGLIVLERETMLDDVVEIGVTLDAAVNKELLASIFHVSSPLHDGAVIVREGRIAHAGCILPLSLRTDLPEGLGTRHRAAIGITEESDAVVVVVSEETGTISVVAGGRLLRDCDAAELRQELTALFTRGSRGEAAEEAAEDLVEAEAVVPEAVAAEARAEQEQEQQEAGTAKGRAKRPEGADVVRMR
jgi:uncharacterized protein (TIGR00159 family)